MAQPRGIITITILLLLVLVLALALLLLLLRRRRRRRRLLLLLLLLQLLHKTYTATKDGLKIAEPYAMASAVPRTRLSQVLERVFGGDLKLYTSKQLGATDSGHSSCTHFFQLRNNCIRNVCGANLARWHLRQDTSCNHMATITFAGTIPGIPRPFCFI